MQKQKGFTLIELLVILSIMGFMGSLVLSSTQKARGKARDAKRRGDLNQIAKALELYANDNGHYPCTAPSNACPGPFPSPAQWWGTCGIYNNNGVIGTTGPTGYVPDIAPLYIKVLPRDPDEKGNSCYLYQSDGIDYKVMAFNTMFDRVTLSEPLYDPVYSPSGYTISRCTRNACPIW